MSIQTPEGAAITYAVLTLHAGGADPAERARLEDEAEHAMRAYADSLPASDEHRGMFDGVAVMLTLRRSRRDFEAGVA